MPSSNRARKPNPRERGKLSNLWKPEVRTGLEEFLRITSNVEDEEKNEEPNDFKISIYEGNGVHDYSFKKILASLDAFAGQRREILDLTRIVRHHQFIRAFEPEDIIVHGEDLALLAKHKKQVHALFDSLEKMNFKEPFQRPLNGRNQTLASAGGIVALAQQGDEVIAGLKQCYDSFGIWLPLYSYSGEISGRYSEYQGIFSVPDKFLLLCKNIDKITDVVKQVGLIPLDPKKEVVHHDEFDDVNNDIVPNDVKAQLYVYAEKLLEIGANLEAVKRLARSINGSTAVNDVVVRSEKIFYSEGKSSRTAGLNLGEGWYKGNLVQLAKDENLLSLLEHLAGTRSNSERLPGIVMNSEELLAFDDGTTCEGTLQRLRVLPVAQQEGLVYFVRGMKEIGVRISVRELAKDGKRLESLAALGKDFHKFCCAVSPCLANTNGNIIELEHLGDVIIGAPQHAGETALKTSYVSLVKTALQRYLAFVHLLNDLKADYGGRIPGGMYFESGSLKEILITAAKVSALSIVGEIDPRKVRQLLPDKTTDGKKMYTPNALIEASKDALEIKVDYKS